MKLYFVSYVVPSEKDAQVSLVLKRAKGWWNYFGHNWIKKKKKSMSDWHAELKRMIGGVGNFIILEVTETFINGWLPNDAWTWINNKQAECKSGGK